MSMRIISLLLCLALSSEGLAEWESLLMRLKVFFCIKFLDLVLCYVWITQLLGRELGKLWYKLSKRRADTSRDSTERKSVILSKEKLPFTTVNFVEYNILTPYVIRNVTKINIKFRKLFLFFWIHLFLFGFSWEYFVLCLFIIIIFKKISIHLIIFIQSSLSLMADRNKHTTAEQE